jgi:hypothetical protein
LSQVRRFFAQHNTPFDKSNLVIAPQAQWGNNEQQEGHLIRTAIPGRR